MSECLNITRQTFTTTKKTRVDMIKNKEWLF